MCFEICILEVVASFWKNTMTRHVLTWDSDAVLSASSAGLCAPGGCWTEEGSSGCRKHCPAGKVLRWLSSSVSAAGRSTYNFN